MKNFSYFCHVRVVKGFLIIVVICDENEVFAIVRSVLYFQAKGMSLGGTISLPTVRVLLGRKGGDAHD
jgi:hypothetical protein